MPPAKE